MGRYMRRNHKYLDQILSLIWEGYDSHELVRYSWICDRVDLSPLRVKESLELLQELGYVKSYQPCKAVFYCPTKQAIAGNVRSLLDNGLHLSVNAIDCTVYRLPKDSRDWVEVVKNPRGAIDPKWIVATGDRVERGEAAA